VNGQELHARLAAANPVHVADLGDSGATTQSAMRLQHIISQPTSRRGRTRRGFVLPSLLGVVATVAAAILVPALLTPATGPQQTIAVSGPAREILFAAAERVPKARTTGRYWRTTGMVEQLVYRNHAGNHYLLRLNTPEDSLAPSDKRDGVSYRNFNIGGTRIRPVTAADAAAYRRDGSPRYNENGAYGVQVPGPPDALEIAGAGFGEGDPRLLPTDPVRMRLALLGWLHGHVDTPARTNAYLFLEAAKLLDPEGTLPSPALRVALYRMLGGLPGVRSLGTVRDPLGRPAIGVVLTDVSAQYGTLDWQLLISPTSDMLLATRAVVLQHGAANPYATPGMVQYLNLVQSAGWTNTKPPA
jgi:hypothetical protein